MTPRLISWFDQNYSFQATYEEDSDPRNRRTSSVPDSVTGSIIRTRDITTKNELNGRWNLKLPALLKAIGKPAGRTRGGAPKVKKQGTEEGKEDKKDLPRWRGPGVVLDNELPGVLTYRWQGLPKTTPTHLVRS